MTHKRRLIGLILVAMLIGVGAFALISSHSGHLAHGHGANHEPDSAGASTSLQSERRMHSEREFTFDLPGTVAHVTPYFGPVKESEWSPDWRPSFLHPAGGGQVEGAIFQTASEWGSALWVMDHYEPELGKVGYVIFVPDVGVTRYEITLAQSDPTHVRIRVRCTRTALNAASPKYIAEFEQHFSSQGPEWQQAIQSILPR
jgi:hypothetical protein